MNDAHASDGLPGWARWATPLVLLACVFAAFSPALSASFVNFDDEANIVDNPGFRGLSADHLEWMWTVPHTGPYMPLTWMSLALDHELWGLGEGLAAPEAPLYHATSVLLHALVALAVYLLGLQLLARAAPGLSPVARALGAAFSSFLFAVHPLRVESVAWVTERRDVLSGVLFVLAVTAYVKASPAGSPVLRARPALAVLACTGLSLVLLALSVELGEEALALRGHGALGLAGALGLIAIAVLLTPRASVHASSPGRTAALALSVGCLVLAFLSKALGVMLPLVLLLCDVWPLRRWTGGGLRAASALVIEKVPYLAVSLVFGVLAIWGQSRSPEVILSLEQHSSSERLAQSFFGLWFYVSRTLVPLGLVPIVELPDTLSFTQPRFLLATTLVLGGSAALLATRRRAPAPLVACLVFLLLVAPVLGLSQTGTQLVADRYSYLPGLSLALLLGGSWALGYERARAPFLALATVTALTLGGLTWRQTRFWQNSESLWAHTAAVVPESGLPHLLMGMLRYRESQQADGATRPALLEEARKHFDDGLRRDPSQVPLYLNAYGALLIDMGDFERAAVVLRQVLLNNPDDTLGLTNLGLALRSLERPGEAVAPLERSVAVDPGNTRGWFQLGVAYNLLGEKRRAARCFETVLQQWPRYGPAARMLRAMRE